MKLDETLTDGDASVLANGSEGRHGSGLLIVALGADVGRHALLVADGLDVARVRLGADDVKKTSRRSRGDSDVDEAQEGDK